jgi:histidinol-phosphate aminotransferase
MAPNFVRATVRAMDGYTPGEQPGIGERVVKLNTNENPFPPSPRVMAALREIEPELLRRYPNPMAQTFRDAAAKVLGVSSDMIIAGNGSDDILTIATRTFLAAGDLLAFPDPTYSLYPVLARLQDARTLAVAWNADYTLPIEALVKADPAAVFLANPNAPTGTRVPAAEVARLARELRGALVVDEAYADFADENCLALAHEHANLIICRTMSKAYSLAGIRFGYAVAQAPIIQEMVKVKDSYNCDAVSVAAATAAILDQEHAKKSWDHIRGERRRLSDELAAMGWSVLPSQANFIFASAPDGQGRAAYMGLKSQGILVRFFDRDGLRDKIRISIGTSQENNALLAGIKGLTARDPVPSPRAATPPRSQVA